MIFKDVFIMGCYKNKTKVKDADVLLNSETKMSSRHGFVF